VLGIWLMFYTHVLAYEKEVLAAKQSGDQGMFFVFLHQLHSSFIFFPFKFCRLVLPCFKILIAGHFPSHSGRMQRKEKNGFLLTPVTGLAGSMPFGFGHPVLLYPFSIRFILFSFIYLFQTPVHFVCMSEFIGSYSLAMFWKLTIE